MSTSTFRLAVVVGVVVISVLGVIAFAAVMAGELTDRSVVVLTAILGFLAPTIASLLVLLRTDEAVERTKQLHEDVLNGPLRENVKKAISEDRHRKLNEDAGRQARAQIAEIQRKRLEASDEGTDPDA